MVVFCSCAARGLTCDCAGELCTFKADNPQASNLLSTKETHGPSTKQICKECMLLQVNLRTPDLSCSFLSPSPPVELRTSLAHKAIIAELKASNVTRRKKLAMDSGYVLANDNMPLANAFSSFPHDLKNKVFDRICYEGQHDFFLGPYEEAVGDLSCVTSCVTCNSD